MSMTKNFYHEEICNGFADAEAEVLDLDYSYEKYQNELTCDGNTTSNCCGASFRPETDYCCDCGEHACSSCVDCETPCGKFVM